MLSAVILAAGEGRRMGRLKQLLPWQDDTMLGTVIQNVLACSELDDELRVVIGAESERVRRSLQDIENPKLKIMENRDYEKGMLTSVRKGLENLPLDTRYIMFTLSDKPLITADIFDTIINKLLEVEPQILLPTYQQKKGHPVIIDAELVPEVFRISGPGGLRSLLWKFPDKVYELPLDRKEVVIDIDYFHEYKRYRNEQSCG